MLHRRRAVAVAWIGSMLGLCVASTPARAAEKSVVYEMGQASAGSPGDVPVLTAEDMDRLRQERREQIERGTPLGEETDAVEAIQRGRQPGARP